MDNSRPVEQAPSEHLNEQQWLALAGAENDVGARAHLAECRKCAAELEQLRAALENYQRAAQKAAVRTDSFWLRQRTTVVARATGIRAVPRLTWVATFSAILLAAILLTREAPISRPAANPAQVQTSSPESDSALLADVQHSVQRDVPEALEPAALLVDEMNQNSSQLRNH